MICAPLITHAEKVEFLTNYITGPDNHVPLMLIGSGANGKSHVILEVAQQSPVNILVFYTGCGHSFFPSVNPSRECVILIHANGAPDEYALASALNANMVEFKKDPAY